MMNAKILTGPSLPSMTPTNGVKTGIPATAQGLSAGATPSPSSAPEDCCLLTSAPLLPALPASDDGELLIDDGKGPLILSSATGGDYLARALEMTPEREKSWQSRTEYHVLNGRIVEMDGCC